MAATVIKEVMKAIPTLSAEERIEVTEAMYHELGTTTYGDELRIAFAGGKLDAIIAETAAEYERGEALDRFC